MDAVDAFVANPDSTVTNQDTIEVVEWQSSDYGAVVRRFRCSVIVSLKKEVL